MTQAQPIVELVEAPERPSAYWAADDITEALRKAVDTIRRMPADESTFLSSLRSMWPVFPPDYWSAYGRHPVANKLAPATPEAIDALDDIFGWFSWLEADEGRIVWARAWGFRWGHIIAMRQPGESRSREALRRIHNRGLARIWWHLNRSFALAHGVAEPPKRQNHGA